MLINNMLICWKHLLEEVLCVNIEKRKRERKIEREKEREREEERERKNKKDWILKNVLVKTM